MKAGKAEKARAAFGRSREENEDEKAEAAEGETKEEIMMRKGQNEM